MGYILVILSAMGFGLMPIFAMYAYKYGVDVITLLFLRFAIATITSFTYLFIKKKKWSAGGKDWLYLFLLGGILYTMQSTFYFLSVKYIPSSLAALLLYLYIVFVAILSFFVYKERLSKRVLFSIFISLLGMLLILGSPSGSVNIIGILLALGASITYSVYIIVGNIISLKLSPIVTSTFITLFATVSFLIFGISTRSINFTFEAIGWVPILGVALISTTISIFTFFSGMNLIGPTKASILSTLEPIVTVIFAALLLQEMLSWPQLLGGILILFGSILIIFTKEKKDKSMIYELNAKLHDM